MSSLLALTAVGHRSWELDMSISGGPFFCLPNPICNLLREKENRWVRNYQRHNRKFFPPELKGYMSNWIE